MGIAGSEYSFEGRIGERGPGTESPLRWPLTVLSGVLVLLGEALFTGRRIATGRANLSSGTANPGCWVHEKPPGFLRTDRYWGLTIATMLLSNLGFLAAAAASGFRFPLFQADVTTAAADFFGLRGSASLFDVGKVGVLFCAWWIVHLSRRRGGRLRTAATVVLALVYVAEQLLIGKRMGLLLSLGALGILLATRRVLRPRHVAAAALLAIVFVTANAYTRAKPYFETGWRNEDVSALSDLWQLAALQPVVYVTETFANLGTVAPERLDPRRRAWTDHVFRRAGEEELAAPTDAYLELRGRGKMVPFVGAGMASGGTMAGLLLTVLFAAIAWIAYAWSQRSVGVIVYADLGARYLVVWTGNFLVNGGTYYNLAYTAALLALAALARLERSTATQAGAAPGAVPADE